MPALPDDLKAATLHDFLHRVTRLLDGKQVVVILDQFEEVFTEQDDAQREAFITQLATCLNDDLRRELTLLGINQQTLDRVLAVLLESRLLRMEEQGTARAYELTHDYLRQEIQLSPEVKARKGMR